MIKIISLLIALVFVGTIALLTVSQIYENMQKRKRQKQKKYHLLSIKKVLELDRQVRNLKYDVDLVVSHMHSFERQLKELSKDKEGK